VDRGRAWSRQLRAWFDVKVCVVGPTYPYRGGISHYTTLLVRHLRAMGHSTHLYSFTRQYPRWLFPGKTDEDPSAAPLRTDCEYVLDPLNPATWRRLYRRIRANAPDVLVLQWWVPYWTPCLAMISRWIKRNTDIRIVFICHNVVPHDGGGALDRWLATLALHRGDVFIVHSEQNRHELEMLLPHVTVIKAQFPSYAELADNSSDRSVGELRRQLGLPNGHRAMLFFGFVRPYKGLDYLVGALPLVLEKLRVRLVVVGEFWSPVEFYQRIARELGVEHAVTFVNRYIPNEDLKPYFDLADVVVLPYVSATQSAVVQLAFGFGKPVITTRVGGLHEVVQDGVNGLIVPPQDRHVLADAIVRFYEQNLGSRFTANILSQYAQQRHSWAALVQVIEQAIEHG